MDTPGYIRYFGAVGWVVCMLFSMIGWGALASRALSARLSRDWGQAACTGIALTTVVGGILNFFGLISRLSIVLFIVLGLLALVYGRRRDRQAKAPTPHSGYSWLAKGLLLAAGLLLCVRFFGAVVTTQAPDTVYPAINAYDDLQGYLVFPEKMIQTGKMGVDPFSLRRTPTHTLGGAPFLKALILVTLSEENIPLLDAGLGAVLVVGVLLGYLGEIAVSAVGTGIVLLVFLLMPAPIWNTTPMLIPLALFLSLFRVLSADRSAGDRSLPIIAGLHVAALASLKTSLIPAALAFGGITYLIASLAPGRSRTVAKEAGIASLSCVLFISPWIADMYRITGNLFPVSLSIYHANPEFIRTLKEQVDWRSLPAHLASFSPIPFLVIAVLLFFTGGGRERPQMERVATVSLMMAILIGVVSVALGMGGFNFINRYVLPFVEAGTLVAVARFVASCGWRVMNGRPLFRTILAGGAAIGLLLGANARETKTMYAGCIHAAVRGINGERLVPREAVNRQMRQQMSIPPGATVFARLERPFLLDFKRNQVFIMDFPGGASLAPGMPFFAGSGALAEYLTSRGIRYVALDYRALNVMIPSQSVRMSSFAITAFQLTDDVDHNFEELGRSRRRIFDDGSAFVLDLLQRQTVELTRY